MELSINSVLLSRGAAKYRSHARKGVGMGYARMRPGGPKDLSPLRGLSRFETATTASRPWLRYFAAPRLTFEGEFFHSSIDRAYSSEKHVHNCRRGL